MNTKLKMILAGTAASLIAGTTTLLGACSAQLEPSSSNTGLTTRFHGADYPVEIHAIDSSANKLTATVQLVGGPRFTLTAHRVAGELHAVLESEDARYKLDATPLIVSSEYIQLRNGEMIGNQYMWAMRETDPSRAVANTDGTSDEGERVLREETPHGALIVALDAIALGEPSEIATSLSDVVLAAGILEPTPGYAREVLAANEPAALPPPTPVLRPIACEVTDETGANPNSQPGVDPGDPTVTPTTQTTAALAPECGDRICNQHKAGATSGPTFDLELGNGLLKLSAAAATASLAATGWADDAAFGVSAVGGGSVDPVNDGVFCCTIQPNGKCLPNDYTWEHKKGTLFADAKTTSGACASPSDQDQATAGTLNLTIKGVAKVAYQACTSKCDGSSHTRGEITGEAVGCFKKGADPYYERGWGKTTCLCQ